MAPTFKVRLNARKVVVRSDAKAAGVSYWPIPDGDPAVMVNVKEAWVVKPLADGWIAAYAIAQQAGRLVVSEMRVYPDEHQSATTDEPAKNPHAGEWSGHLTGIAATVPEGGLTATITRQATLGQDVTGALPEIIARMQREFPRLSARLNQWGLTAEETRAKVADGGRRGKPRTFYARVAEVYAAAAANGSGHPVEDVARTLHLRVSTAKNAVAKARGPDMGFLSPSLGRGSKGGSLTLAGRTALGKAEGAGTEKAHAVLQTQSTRSTRRMRGSR